MDWKVMGTTAVAIFLAEMADKTQLVTLTMTSKTGKPVAVWLGSVAGYALVMLLSVAVGAALGKYLKPEWIRVGGGALFVGLGILMLVNKS